MRVTKVISMATTIMCVAVPILGACAAHADRPIVYNNPARTFREQFKSSPSEGGGFWWEGRAVLPRHPTDKQKRDIFFDEPTTDRLWDCSDNKLLCLYGAYRVFAIPRAGVQPSSEYLAAGAFFRVERCIRGSDDRCQVALISSDCQNRSEAGRCTQIPGGRLNSHAPGPIGYFIFNEDSGVTAYGFRQEPALTAEDRFDAAAGMVLRSERGLLTGKQ